MCAIAIYIFIFNGHTKDPMFCYLLNCLRTKFKFETKRRPFVCLYYSGHKYITLFLHQSDTSLKPFCNVTCVLFFGFFFFFTEMNRQQTGAEGVGGGGGGTKAEEERK